MARRIGEKAIVSYDNSIADIVIPSSRLIGSILEKTTLIGGIYDAYRGGKKRDYYWL